MVRYEVGIIGGSGFVGSSLAEHLSSSYSVKLLDKTKVPDRLQGLVGFEICDVTKYEEVMRAIEDVELVIHTAIVQIPLINENKRLGYDVNVLGVQNICEAVNRTRTLRGALLSGSWHVFGERDFRGIVDEGFGYRPDKIEDRARLYALCKIAQESIFRLYDEMSPKTYGTIRIGTVLGEGMPEKTAANIFITKGLKGEPITPFRQSMHRPMLYVDIVDVCKAFETYAKTILESKTPKEEGSFSHVFNLFWPRPTSIVDLARIVRDKISKCSCGKIVPEIRVVDTGDRIAYSARDKRMMKVSVSKADRLLDTKHLTSPAKVIERIVRERLRIHRQNQ